MVLVVDDEETVRGFFRRLLTAEGYAVMEAGDGPSGLAAIAEGKPDVVLLDVQLQGMTGFDVCRRSRQDIATRLTPVSRSVRLCARITSGSTARGYPDGLSGDEIPLVAQIIGLVDVYEAITTRRPYQEQHSTDEAVHVLRRHVACGWRRDDLVETFVANLPATASWA